MAIAKTPSKETEDYIKQHLQYVPLSGEFTWVKGGYGIVLGSQAGCVDKKGYRVIRVNSVCLKAHRLAWFIHYGEWPKGQIDHLNRIKTDNRIENLRDASQSDNQKNVGLRSDNTSSARGVSWYKPYSKWRVRINLNGKSVLLGYFECFAEAVKVRREADSKHGFKPTQGVFNEYS